jgi:hypothetical protein
MSYELATEVGELAKPLIEAYHRHLLKAKVGFVFRDKAWKTFDSKTVLGRAAKRNELDQLLSKEGEDFVIVVGKDKWEKMTDVEKRCLVDHELCHAGVRVDVDGHSVFVLRSHVIEEFPENLARFEHRRKLLGDLIQSPPSPITTRQLRRITSAIGEETGGE